MSLQVESTRIIDPAAAGAALKVDRTILLRRVLDADLVGRYGTAMKERYDEYLRAVEAPGLDRLTKHLRHCEWFRSLHEAAGLRHNAIVREIARSPVLDVIRAYGGTDVVLGFWHRIIHSRPQLIANKREALPYHQDGFLIDANEPFVRAWVLLHPASAGDISAGLKLLPQRKLDYHPIDPNPISDEYKDFETSHAVIARIEAEQVAWKPIVHVGDVLIFLGDVLHATWFPETATLDRWALEFTFTPATEAAIEKLERDYCVFTPDGVIYPADVTIERWFGEDAAAEVDPPEIRTKLRPGFLLIK